MIRELYFSAHGDTIVVPITYVHVHVYLYFGMTQAFAEDLYQALPFLSPDNHI